MENKEDKIEQEIQKTLSSIDRRQYLEANSYLFSKVKERISNQSTSDRSNFFFLNKVQPAFFVVLLLVNFYIGFTVLNATSNSEDFMESLAEEYNLENTDLSNYYISE